MQEQIPRPLPDGARIVYYNRERYLDVEATVKSAGFHILWVVDVEESSNRDHYITYRDIVAILSTDVKH